jgi:hypothetical protein
MTNGFTDQLSELIGQRVVIDKYDYKKFSVIVGEPVFGLRGDSADHILEVTLLTPDGQNSQKDNRS